ncbi:hypothetical protein AXF42_Ash021733 [Apostasia shenzhenica]|uniref:Uncharacterized protein n=1 Tax=Apostasia shenzhenica TaxID=1088818 RepID=A0A2H9ZYP8_9ASPA|nr:hypothetical protein AXF42_Ash021733 [Apostasia shenzhenica]
MKLQNACKKKNSGEEIHQKQTTSTCEYSEAIYLKNKGIPQEFGVRPEQRASCDAYPSGLPPSSGSCTAPKNPINQPINLLSLIHVRRRERERKDLPPDREEELAETGTGRLQVNNTPASAMAIVFFPFSQAMPEHFRVLGLGFDNLKEKTK